MTLPNVSLIDGLLTVPSACPAVQRRAPGLQPKPPPPGAAATPGRPLGSAHCWCPPRGRLHNSYGVDTGELGVYKDIRNKQTKIHNHCRSFSPSTSGSES